MTTRMAVSSSGAWSASPGRAGWLVCGRRYAVVRSPGRPAVVRDDDAGGFGGGDGRVQRLDDRDGERPADDLRADEAEYRVRGDPGEGVGEHPADGDGRVGEAGGGREPVRRADVSAHRRRGRPAPPGPDQGEDH